MNRNLIWIAVLLAAALVAVSVRLAMANAEKVEEAGPDTAAAVIENIMTRTSVRAYSDSVVSDSVRTAILKAGMAAPTAANQQAWDFVVVTDRTLKDSISSSFKYTKMVEGCAFAVVVCGNMDKLFDGDWRDGGFWVQDCSAVSENMLLAAHALGLGGVWCGIYPDGERVRKLSAILRLPENLVPLNVLSFGYPAAAVTPKDKWNPKNIHYNAY